MKPVDNGCHQPTKAGVTGVGHGRRVHCGDPGEDGTCGPVGILGCVRTALQAAGVDDDALKRL